MFGAACITVAPFLFSLVDAGSGYGSLVAGMVVLGIGIGSFYPTATTAGVTSVDESQTSLAGGIVYMFQIAGGSIGLGLTTTVFSPAIPPFVDGIQAAFRLDAALSLVGFVIALLFVGGRLLSRSQPAPRPPPEPPLVADAESGPLELVAAGAADQRVFAGPTSQHVVAARRRRARRRRGRRRAVVAAAPAERCRRRRRRPACPRPPPPTEAVARPAPPRRVDRDRDVPGDDRRESSPPPALTSKPPIAVAWQISSFGRFGRVPADVAADFQRHDRVDHVVAAVGAEPDADRVRFGAAGEEHV